MHMDKAVFLSVACDILAVSGKEVINIKICFVVCKSDFRNVRI